MVWLSHLRIFIRIIIIIESPSIPMIAKSMYFFVNSALVIWLVILSAFSMSNAIIFVVLAIFISPCLWSTWSLFAYLIIATVSIPVFLMSSIYYPCLLSSSWLFISLYRSFWWLSPVPNSFSKECSYEKNLILRSLSFSLNSFSFLL